MRSLILPLCFLVSLPAVAAGTGQDNSPFGALSGLITKGLQKGIGEPALANNNRYLVELQFLAPYKLKVSKEPRCNAYVDLTLAASQSTGYTPDAIAGRKERLRESLNRGWQAKCYIPKTALEAMQSGLRMFWEPRHARLSAAPACASYVQQSNNFAFSEGDETQKRFALSQLYVDATQRGCMQP
jgi:hypothetical protein